MINRKGQFFLLGAILLAIMFFAGLSSLKPVTTPPSEDLKFFMENVKKDLPHSLNLGLQGGSGVNDLGNFTQFTDRILTDRFVNFTALWLVAEPGYNTRVRVTVGNFLDTDQVVNVTIGDATQTADFGLGGGGSGVFGGGGSTCGNRGCDGTESCSSCPTDCGICGGGGGGGGSCGNGVVNPGEECDPPNPGNGCSSSCRSEYCGNSVCDLREDCVNCDADCGECPSSVCGNAACEIDELCSTCNVDCYLCPPQTILIFVSSNSTNSTEFFPVSNKYIIEISWAGEYREFTWLREKVNFYADVILEKEDDIIREEIVA